MHGYVSNVGLIQNVSKKAGFDEWALRRLGVFLLPLDDMLVHCRALNYSFTFLGGERHCESNVSSSRAQCNDLGLRQGWNLDHVVHSPEQLG